MLLYKRGCSKYLGNYIRFNWLARYFLEVKIPRAAVVLKCGLQDSFSALSSVFSGSSLGIVT